MTVHANPERQPRYVLVVDSNHRDLLYTAMILQNFGYNVTTLQRAEEALELLSVALPSVVVTELELAGISGLELLKKIRENPDTNKLPVVIQTSLTSLETRNICSRAGCTLYIRKPVSAEAVYRAAQSSIEATPRRSARIRTHLPVTIFSDANPHRDGGEEFITVLSEDGLFVKTLTPRPAGSRHSVRFVLAHRGIAAEAETLYGFTFAEGPFREPGMGMKFVYLNPVDREVIREFIILQIDKGLAPLSAAE